MNHVFRGTPRQGGYQDIAVSNLAGLPDTVRMVDVRQPEEFEGELGHLERAELVPLAALGDTCVHWKKDEPILLICRSGSRSSQAARALAQVGFSNLANLAGGMLALRDQG